MKGLSIATAISLCAFTQVFADPAITDVTARQRYPWGGAVDIAYTMTESVATNLVEGLCPRIVVSATDRATGNSYEASTLAGDVSSLAGRHSVVWDMAADGVALYSTDVVFSVSCEMEPALYCVIDLSAGSSASSYPVTYLAEPPSGGFNVDAYKTTKLVLRRIDPGTFMMCGQYETILTKPYYVGIFEMTQKQYQLVTGSNPSQYKGDMRPVENLDYETVRPLNWTESITPESTCLIGKLRKRTNIQFDLPTEAEWEYACRAGTTSDFNNGGNAEADMKLLGRYSGNRNDGKGGYSEHTKVGSYSPNAWGLYDMHGNVWEWCLDWVDWDLENSQTDPIGPSSGSYKRKRGGSFTYAFSRCSSSNSRDSGMRAIFDNSFRLVCRITAQIGTIMSDESEPVAIDLPQTALNWTTGGGEDWAPFDGNADSPGCLKSGAIPDGTNSWMKTVVTGPGKLSFDWKVSCENRNYAYLEVVIDGVRQKRITGVKDWESLLYEIAAGEHEVKWNYVKDGASAVGEDAGFVRNISWRPYLSFASVTAHGTASPADSDALLYGDAVEASVAASVTEGNVRYDCVGWTGTGSAPALGGSNTCTFVIREDSSLAWLWRTNYWTSVTVAGPATANFAEDWLEAGTNISVAVAPEVPFFSILLSGDTEGVTLDGTNIVFAATAPRAIVATVVELTFAEALDTTNLAWRTGGDAIWFPQGAVSSDGEDAAQSGSLDAKATSWIETAVIGPGTLSFKWRFDAGSANSGIDFLIDEEYEEGLADATDGFETYIRAIGAGRHVLRWEFYGSNGGGNGTAWLDAVAWDGDYPTATSTTPTPVPYIWLDANAKPLVTRFYGDYEAAAHDTAANGVNKVWECYVAGLVPTNAADLFRTVISISGGKPQISWEPRLSAEEEAKRTYTIYGRESLTDGEWTTPTNAASHFFKVRVTLP